MTKENLTNFTYHEAKEDSEFYAVEILDAKYYKVTAKECVQKQKYMLVEECDKFSANKRKYLMENWDYTLMKNFI